MKQDDYTRSDSIIEIESRRDALASTSMRFTSGMERHAVRAGTFKPQMATVFRQWKRYFTLV